MCEKKFAKILILVRYSARYRGPFNSHLETQMWNYTISMRILDVLPHGLCPFCQRMILKMLRIDLRQQSLSTSTELDRRGKD